MKQDVQPRLFNIVGAANYVGVSPRTIEEYIAAGRLHAYRLPAIREDDAYLKRTLIERTELDKLVDRGVRL